MHFGHAQLTAKPTNPPEIITGKAGEEVILKNVHFSHNSFELNESSYTELNKLIDYLQKNPQIKITVEGHTDNVGERKENIILSENRAKSVYDYLVQKTIKTNRLLYEGFGENKPIADNETASGRARNRRTSFKIIQ